MKNRNRRTIDIFSFITAVLICVLMCFCLSACGESSNTEETVEITTPSEEPETAIYEKETSGDEDKDKDEDSSDDSDSQDSDSGKKADSKYEQIYMDCNAQMKDDTAKYVKELKKKSSSLSKSKLYDETQDRIDELKKVYDDGKDKMVDTMLASTEDDEKAYKKYFNKLTEAYTEYTRDITSAYTDAF